MPDGRQAAFDVVISVSQGIRAAPGRSRFAIRGPSMIKTTLSACAVAALLFAAAADAGTARVTRAEARAHEVSLKQRPAASGMVNLRDTVDYSATTAGAPAWNRPFADCTGQSMLGPVNHHTQLFHVDQTGNYAISSASPGWDGFIFVYTHPFTPTSPNVNCITGNDDGDGGVGTSWIPAIELTAGTQYVLVTTAFEAGEEGAFTNTLTGPGTIILGGLPTADLGIGKTAPDGVANGGDYLYRLVASNAGPGNASAVTVTDTLPADVAFVDSTCAATVVGQVVTWAVGGLANGDSATCDITVNRASTMCTEVINTASIVGGVLDPNPGNDTAMHSNGAGADPIVDGGFEAAGAPAWTQTSSNFGSPLCGPSCGTGGGTAGPNSGSQWMWFGGAGGAPETGSAQQSVAIPTGPVSLEFHYWLGECGAGANDFIRLTVGGTELWRRDATSAECDAGGYTSATVDISAFAGGTHVVRFESTTGTTAQNANFHIDDVRMLNAPVCFTPIPIDVVPAVGGSVSCTPNPVVPGSDSTCTATADAGYAFTGWVAGCSGSNPVCTLSDISAPLAVEAGFGDIIDGACGAADGVATGTPPTAGLCDAGTASSVTAAADAFSWTCQGMLGGSDAQCEAPRSYTIATSVLGSGGITPGGPLQAVFGSTPAFEVVATPGNELDAVTGCGGSLSGTTYTIAPVAGDCTVQASFTGISLPVTVTPSAGGSVSCAPNPVPHGGSTTCTATPEVGQDFTGWLAGCTGSNPVCTLTNVTAPVTVQAGFAGILLPVTVTPGTGGSVSCAPDPVPYGGSTTCTATPDAGHAFTDWLAGCTGGNPVCVLDNVTSVVTVQAGFTGISLPVTVTASAGGSVSCTPNPVPYNGSTTCTATADAGQVFSGWSGDCAGPAVVCTLDNVTSAQTVGGQFRLLVAPVNVPVSSPWMLLLLASMLGLAAMQWMRAARLSGGRR